MRRLGFNPQPLSGASWILSEDGESATLMAQLKSTEGESISVKKQTITDLVRHATIAHKTPVLILEWVGAYKLICFLSGDIDAIVQLKEQMQNG